ncbi:MAG: hypothetical protein LE180_05270 [Endomicrobium sp.]|uniref:hypothetical protein n=1 Tax=Candidatus Endomicrobiellum pyrsonymphae TaxID=1408203 RepID=UPI003581631C|nr:hypothetical protein [Endomicrobium sp.]
MRLIGEEALATTDEQKELQTLFVKIKEAGEKALTPDEKKELDKLDLKVKEAGEKALTPDEKKELDKLNLKVAEAGKTVLTPEQYERMEVLVALMRMAPDEKKKYLVKMKATELKEWMTLFAKVEHVGEKALTSKQQKRKAELWGKTVLTLGEQKEKKALQMKMEKAVEKALTPEQQKRIKELSNLLQ